MSRVDLKVVLLGKEFGGKTSLVERFIHNRFQGDIPYQNTIGAAYAAKKLNINGKSLTMGIWDTAGSERYEAMSKIYYRGAYAAIICHDITDDISFEKARFWIDELRKNEENCRIYLCGTKKDLIDKNRNARKTDYHLVTDLGDEIKAPVFETSSKTGENVDELFSKIAEDFVTFPPQKVKDIEDSLAIEEVSVPKKSFCCS